MTVTIVTRSHIRSIFSNVQAIAEVGLNLIIELGDSAVTYSLVDVSTIEVVL